MPKSKPKSIKARGREEMEKEIWTQKATAFADCVENHMCDIKVLLLGPGFPEGQLEIRQAVKEQLEAANCTIFLMEELDPVSSFNIDEKFRDILDEINPDLIICIFTEEGAPHGVIFEVGFICGHLGIDEGLERLRFCFHERVEKIENLPAYLHFIASRTQHYEFYDEGEGPTLFDRIYQFIRDEVSRRFC